MLKKNDILNQSVATARPKAVKAYSSVIKENRISRPGSTKKKWLLPITTVVIAAVILLASLLYAGLINDRRGGKAFSGTGAGTVIDPYLVSTCSQLQEINNDLSASYTLTGDIDCSDTYTWDSGKGFQPIGDQATNNYFTGTFDGRNHTISSLTINRPQVDPSITFTALFQSTQNATIKNLTLNTASIRSGAMGSYQMYISSLIGYADSTNIFNIRVTGSNIEDLETGNNTQVSGVVGFMYGSSLNRVAIDTSVVRKGQSISGIVGSAQNGSTMSNCYSDVDYQPRPGYDVSGVVFSVFDNLTTISKCYSTGTVSGVTQVGMRGGIIGYRTGSGLSTTMGITDSFSDIDFISANQFPYTDFTGGLAGGFNGYDTPIENVLISNSFFDSYKSDTADCVGRGFNGTPIPGCTAIDGNASPNYFFNNTTNGPFPNWDFSNVWQTTNERPTLRTANISPEAPTNLTSDVSGTTINLNWLAPNNTGGDAITQYRIYYKPTSNGDWILFNDSPATSTTISIPDLSANTSYDFRVQAVNINGYGFFSNTSQSTTASSMLTPRVKTSAASGILSTSATLVGLTSAKGVTARGFEYGLDTNYNFSTTDSSPLTYGYDLMFGSNGTGGGQFNNPGSIATDSQGNVYVADPQNNRIQKFDSSGSYLLHWGTAGSGNGQFDGLKDIAIDSQDNIYVVESNNARVQKFDSSGNYLLQWGSSGSSNGQFSYTGARGIAVDKTNNSVYVSDINLDRVQKFDSSGNYLLQWGSTGTGDGQFATAFGLAVDSSGDVYVGDPDLNRIQKFDSSGNRILEWGVTGSGNSGFQYLSRIAIDSNDQIYVLDSNINRVQIFGNDGTYLDEFGQSGNGDEILNETTGIAINSHDELYVSEIYVNQIKKFKSKISVTIVNLACSTTYHYRAYATNSSGTSYGLDKTLTTDPCAGLPPAPQNLTLTAGVTSVYLDWEPPVNDGGSPITDYLVDYKPTADQDWIPYPNVVSTTSNLLVEGLLPNTSYSFRVVALNANGSGPDVSGSVLTNANEAPVLSGAPTVTTVTINWTEPPNAVYYNVQVKESTSNDWNAMPAPSYIEGPTAHVYPLKPNTSYDFRVRVDYAGGQYGDWSNILSLTTLTQQSYTITTCRQLQAIAVDPVTLAFGDLEGDYTIANDIDCSDTVNWDWATLFNQPPPINPGFLPLYGYDLGLPAFTGNLHGQNHSISNLYQYSNILNPLTGLIGFAAGGTIEDLHMTDAQIYSPASFSSGGMISTAMQSTLTNLSFSGSIDSSAPISDSAELTRLHGGLVGYLILSQLDRSWVDVSITTGVSPDYVDTTPTESWGFLVGGLVGITETSSITNSFADGSITMSGNPDFSLIAGGLASSASSLGIGGLSNPLSTIDKSYASMNITMIDNANANAAAGGLVGIVAETQVVDTGQIIQSNVRISNSFSSSQMNGTTTIQQGGTSKGGLIGIMQGNLADSSLNNNYFDKSRSNAESCIGLTFESLGGGDGLSSGVGFTPSPGSNSLDCAAVNVANAQPDYFINNTCNPPLNTWDFTTIWRAQTLTYPSLDQPRSTNPRSCDTLSPYNPGGETPGGGGTNPTTPTIPGTITKPLIPPLPFSPGTLIPLQNDSANSGFAPSAGKAPAPSGSNWLSRFLPDAWTNALRMIPEDTARVIPFLLILILIATALFYARQAWLEYRNVGRVNALLTRYQATQEANRNFVALTSHYLNTPVNILQSSVELITSLKALTPENSAKLKLAIDNLAHDVRAMVNDSQTSTKHVAESRLELSKLKIGVIARNLHVAAPITLTCIALVIANVLFTQTDRYSLAGIMLFGQIVTFVLACIGVFAAYRSYRRNQLSHTALKHQLTLETDLLSRRVEFITKSYDGLNADLGFIQHYGTLIPKASPVQKPFTNGLTMLGAVLAKFHALIEFSKPLEVFPAPLSVAPLVDAASQTYKTQATEKKLTIKNAVPVGLVLPLSQAALEQLIYSTVENAIKFNRPNGSVSITTHTTKAGVILSIDDTGIGIPKAKLTQLMTPFSRATDVLKFDYEGIGLNLYLNKVLVEQYGGKMTLISQENKGTSVIYQLPSVETANHSNHVGHSKPVMHTPLLPIGTRS